MTTCAVPACQILPLFQEFYAELHRLREQAAHTPLHPTADPCNASERLAHLLEQQAAWARAALDSRGFEIYREAQYVMAALADDLLLHSNGAVPSFRESLEQHFFRASSAGEIFFQKLEVLLQGQEPEHIELARLYFLAICLGFQGKYRNTGDLGALATYRQRLFTMIFSDPPTLTRNDAPLVKLAPVETVAQENMRLLPHPQIWMALPAGVLVLWVLFSFVFWTGFVRPITRMMKTPAHTSSADGR